MSSTRRGAIPPCGTGGGSSRRTSSSGFNGARRCEPQKVRILPDAIAQSERFLLGATAAGRRPALPKRNVSSSQSPSTRRGDGAVIWKKVEVSVDSARRFALPDLAVLE